MRCNFDLDSCGDQLADPADPRDELGDGVLRRHGVIHDRGVQHPPTLAAEHPRRVDHCSDRVVDPPRLIRLPQPSTPIRQRGQVLSPESRERRRIRMCAARTVGGTSETVDKSGTSVEL